MMSKVCFAKRQLVLKNHQDLGTINKAHGVSHVVMNGFRYMWMSSGAWGKKGLDALDTCNKTHMITLIRARAAAGQQIPFFTKFHSLSGRLQGVEDLDRTVMLGCTSYKEGSSSIIYFTHYMFYRLKI